MTVGPQDPMQQPERQAAAERLSEVEGGTPPDADRRLDEDLEEVPNATDPEGEPDTDAGHRSRQESGD